MTTISGNVISGNNGNGVNLAGTKNELYSNNIGMNIDGSDYVAIGNQYTGNLVAGILVTGNDNKIGNATEGNLIAGNFGSAVQVNGTTGNKIQDNIIGADASGNEPRTNDGDAFSLVNPGLGTFIAGNSGYYATGTKGFRVKAANGAAAEDKFMKGNNLQEDPTQAVALDPGSALYLEDCTNLEIDDSVFDTGVTLVNCTNIVLQNNYIGTDANGTNFGNPGDGLFIDMESSNIAALGNTIAYNGGDGIDSAAQGLSLANNIVTNNGLDGVFIAMTVGDVTIGDGGGNLIADNGGNGITIEAGVSLVSITNNTVQGNAADGIYVAGSFVTTSNNAIAANGGDGLYVTADHFTGTGDSIAASNTVGIFVDWWGGALLEESMAASLVVAGTAHIDGSSAAGSVLLAGGTLELDAGASLVVAGDYSASVGVTYLDSGSLLSIGGAMSIGDQLDIDDATVQVAGGLSAGCAAMISGTGTIEADVSNYGHLAVGGMGPSGVIHIAGNYTQFDGATLALAIDEGGAVDTLAVDGLATLDGELSVGGPFWLPANGEVFVLITYGSRSGGFSQVYAPGGLQEQYDVPPGTFCLVAPTS
jgi:hypothetical protein